MTAYQEVEAERGTSGEIKEGFLEEVTFALGQDERIPQAGRVRKGHTKAQCCVFSRPQFLVSVKPSPRASQPLEPGACPGRLSQALGLFVDLLLPPGEPGRCIKVGRRKAGACGHLSVALGCFKRPGVSSRPSSTSAISGPLSQCPGLSVSPCSMGVGPEAA